MGKKWIWFSSVLLAFLFIVLTLLFYLVWGGKFYFEARKSISRLSNDKRAIANGIFNSKGEYLYSGIFMGVNNLLFKGVWVWGEKGPRFFFSDEYTVYSYFQMCKQENITRLGQDGLIQPERNISTDLNTWKKNIKVGNFISVQLANLENGGNLGKLREALAYDWWIFNSSIPIDTQCEK